MTRILIPLAMLSLGCGSKSAPSDGPTDLPGDDTSPPPDDSGEPPLASFEVSGRVVDPEGLPVSDAIVMVGGRDDTMVVTDEDGLFNVWYEFQPDEEPAIVAGKLGYRTKGWDFFKPDEFGEIVINPVNPPDNIDYIYKYPGDGLDTLHEDCSHCHVSFVDDFLSSKHAEATRNPLVQDLYAGVSAHPDTISCEDAGGVWALGYDPGTEGEAITKCYTGGGVLPDLNTTCGGMGQPTCDEPGLGEDIKPTAFGACADCHAPGINGVAGGRNLHDALGIAFEMGVHCDTCHKVRDIDLSKPPGVGQRLVMGRPSEPGTFESPFLPVFFGPLVDVPNPLMGGSFQPKFDSAEFCAGCHEQTQPALLPGESLDETLWPDGLPTHSTFSEWSAGPYNQDATQCQFCHMPADVEAVNAVHFSTIDKRGIVFGWPREPDNIRKHIFRGPLVGEPRLIDTALYTSIALIQEGDTLEATVSLSNIGCGHAIPTGEPMRALVLVVEARGDCGNLTPSGGMTVSDIGGALAMGTAGTDVEVDEASLNWSEAANLASIGQVIRVVRPTGVFDDYSGVGVFGDPEMEAEDKGMEVHSPVGIAIIDAIAGDTLSLSASIDILAGDTLFLGEALPDELEDGSVSRHLAGTSGYTFSRVLIDSSGVRSVPHYKAVDMVSDNRIGPGENALTSHAFTLPDGCSDVEVRATVMYRPHPLNLAVERDWTAVDHVISTATARIDE
jgi:hypothetical protein